MNPITNFVTSVSTRSREKRASILQKHFLINKDTKILDLGSENGANINRVLYGTEANSKNVYIADINPENLNEGQKRFGYKPVPVAESGVLPFQNDFFDIVFCSSVIEHVTIPKIKVWKSFSENRFKKESFQRQKEFAKEIKRVGKQYFVQTPYKYFPIESHTWLPLIGILPRWLLIPILYCTNFVWVKRTKPDWHLLNKRQMKQLFPDAQIIEEKMLGLTKSIMAVHRSF